MPTILALTAREVKSIFTDRAREIGLNGGNVAIAQAFPGLSARLIAAHGVAFFEANQAAQIEKARRDGIEAGRLGLDCETVGPTDARHYDAFAIGHAEGAVEAARWDAIAEDAAIEAEYDRACEVGYGAW